MNWYYAAGEEQKGPVEQSEFDGLVQSGAITPSTLVWHEGMGEWRAFSEVSPAPTPTIPSAPVAASRPGIMCSECGRSFAPDEVIRLGTGYVCAACKPLAVQRIREGGTGTADEQIRRDHIKHEASVRSVGVLYFLGCVALVLAGTMGMAAGELGSVLIGVVLTVLGVLQGWVGFGLRKLKKWARIPTAILSGIGLLGFPLGTLINAYILYLVLSEKGKMVFSDDYQRIIEATPHIKYRTSIIVWILVGLVLFALAAALILPLLVRHR